MIHPFPETRASLLLRLPNASDLAAWDEFVSLYSPCVVRVVTRAGMQQADAENVLQEFLLRVAKSTELWRNRTERGGFRPWLLRIAKNETINLLTRKATRPFEFTANSVGANLELLAVIQALQPGSLYTLRMRFWKRGGDSQANDSILVSMFGSAFVVQATARNDVEIEQLLAILSESVGQSI